MSKSRRELIYERVMEALQPEYLEVIDESDQHIGHAGHQGGNRHFAIIIKSSQLASSPTVDAHRIIYALFSDMIPDQIHALRIKLLKD